LLPLWPLKQLGLVEMSGEAISTNTRLIATQVMYQVVVKHQHLKQTLHNTLAHKNFNHNITVQDKAWIQNICYQSLRHHQNLSARWQKFINKPLKDKLIAELLTLSMAQKHHLNTPDHAIVNEAVNTAKKLKKHWATSLVNKVLKLALKDQYFTPSNEVETYNHPQWWIELLRKDWPDHWQQILNANNQKPPLWIRAYTPNLKLDGQPHPQLKCAWQLADTQTSSNTELKQGQISVQDAAAQYAAYILKPKAGEKILDACAAPGGKSGHLLEVEPNIQLDILEKEPDRLTLIKENLDRLKLKASRLIEGDATLPKTWFQGYKYDKILLDVPCSAAGVVRRNPDIKLLRQPQHIKQLADLQQQILIQMVDLVKTGGQILYVTCSVFRSENERQIKKILQKRPDFHTVELDITLAENCLHGQQIVTGNGNMDGFYYCLLEKSHA